MEHYTLYDKLVNAYEHAEEDRKFASRHQTYRVSG